MPTFSGCGLRGYGVGRLRQASPAPRAERLSPRIVGFLEIGWVQQHNPAPLHPPLPLPTPLRPQPLLDLCRKLAFLLWFSTRPTRCRKPHHLCHPSVLSPMPLCFLQFCRLSTRTWPFLRLPRRHSHLPMVQWRRTYPHGLMLSYLRLSLAGSLMLCGTKGKLKALGSLSFTLTWCSATPYKGSNSTLAGSSRPF